MAASNTQPSSHASRSAITNSNACSKVRSSSSSVSCPELPSIASGHRTRAFKMKDAAPSSSNTYGPKLLASRSCA
ncbi:hypothetical protein M3J09_008482 [Ascochyta lentis]